MDKNNPVVNKQDQRIAIIVASIIVLGLFIYLKLAYYLMADPPPKIYPLVTSMDLPAEINLKEMKIEGGGGGSGTPNDAPIAKQAQNQTEKVITKSDSKTEVNTGESNHSTETPNPTNEASTRVQSPNPFGSGGSGGGTGSGIGRGFGNDDGDGIGPGNGPGTGGGSGGLKPREPRTRLTSPQEIESNQSGVVYLLVTINADGTVVKAVNLNNETTITDQRIINQVVGNVKAQVKYNKKPGTTPQTQRLRIDVKAT